MKTIKGSITTPKGFKAAGIHCGIKKSGKFDLGIITSDTPCPTACVFTKNSVKAAPLIVSQNHLRDAIAQAIIVNSGNANCFTGKFGLTYAEKTTQLLAQELNIKTSDVVVTSTGIIGKPLPIKKIEKGVPACVKQLSPKGAAAFEKAILTTDLVKKNVCVTLTLAGKKVTIAGCAKGSGMIEPNMATMLGFVTTDAAISKTLLKTALKEATNKSFNRITVDGCMSTNDMVVLMANGAAKNPSITKKNKDYFKFVEALHYVCLDLAKKIVYDGEGAKLFIEIHVKAAKTQKQADQVAKAIANSNLVKTANYGPDPNWGRVAAAAGSLGFKGINEKTLKLKFDYAKKDHVSIYVDLNLGSYESIAYTSDLTKKYITINNQYN